MFRKIAIAATLAGTLLAPAHAGDVSIYVTMGYGAEVCKLDKDDPDIRRRINLSYEQIGKRMLNGEATSAQLAAWKKEIEERDRAELCTHVANLHKVLDDAIRRNR